jgi:hypothetical protein
MPITVRANERKFTFPDGTSQDQISQAIDEFFSQTAAKQSGGLTQEFAVESALALGGDTGAVPAPADEQTMSDYLLAVPEVAKTLAAGATVGTLGYAGGFAEGLFDEIMSGQFGTPEAAKRIEQKALERSTGFTGMFAPESEAGQEMLEGIGELAGAIPVLPPLAAEAQALSAAARASAPILTSKFGRNVALIDQQTGLPSQQLARAMNKKDVKYSLILEEPGALPDLTRVRTADEAVDAVIRKRIKQGSGNESLAGVKLDGAKIVKDPFGVEAVRQGYRPGDVASAKNTNIQTKAKMSEMLNIKRRIQGDSSVALEIRPSKIAGDALMERFSFVRDKASSLRKELDAIANGEVTPGTLPGPGVRQPLKGLNIDTSSIETSVLDGLRKLNIDIPDEIGADTTKLADHLRSKGAFVGSDISKDRTSQRVIKDTLDLLSEPGEADALRAHRVKRQIDTMVDFRKKEAKGLTESGENFANSIRRSLNDSIREINPEYARVNDELSRSLDSMNNFKDALPRKVNFFGENLEEAFGQELRVLLGNRQSRQELRNSIKELDDTARSFGQSSDIDINKLVQFNNTLDDRFGATARGSFKGEIESGLRTLRPTEIVKEKASQAVIDSINKLRQVNDEKAFDAMQELLKRNK